MLKVSDFIDLHMEKTKKLCYPQKSNFFNVKFLNLTGCNQDYSKSSIVKSSTEKIERESYRSAA